MATFGGIVRQREIGINIVGAPDSGTAFTASRKCKVSFRPTAAQNLNAQGQGLLYNPSYGSLFTTQLLWGVIDIVSLDVYILGTTITMESGDTISWFKSGGGSQIIGTLYVEELE